MLDTDDNADVTLIGTGSEVHLAVEVAHKLRERNIGVRVVSMPCVSLFCLKMPRFKKKFWDRGSE